ncbi:hypothetical protein BS47DRAFT_1365530 [Hydnum rufescens UP504]|uniref:Uncharacterized protein n=1 Tax=Hydnum rufescens UP504 TaxID=1448309 RepID=A0A9P6DNK7_9AGAM|nr:hypothetical protein BS47DRAFT_1365530 [Hydnum rufescens UP504]
MTTNKDRVDGANEEGDDENQADPPIHLEPGSLWLPPPVFSPHLPRTLTQKCKQDHIDMDAHPAVNATRPQTKKNRTNGETVSHPIDNSDEHLDTLPRSPWFGTLLLPKSTMAQNDSMSHPHSSCPIPLDPTAIEEDTNGKVTVGLTHPLSPCILFESPANGNDSNDEVTIGLGSLYCPPSNRHIPFKPMTDTDDSDDAIVGSVPNTVGLSCESQQNEPPFSIIPIHYNKQPPTTVTSKKSKVVAMARVRAKSLVSSDGEYKDPDFWPGSPSIKSSQPFLIGTILEPVTSWAKLLRDKFLEDLSTLADESQYPHLGLLKATQLNLTQTGQPYRGALKGGTH